MITINVGDPTPPFEQLRRQLSDEIRTGALAPGTRLPSVRQLAGDLRIAAGTVARAYSELEAEGLLASTRSGTRVKEVDTLPQSARDAARNAPCRTGHPLGANGLVLVRGPVPCLFAVEDGHAPIERNIDP